MLLKASLLFGLAVAVPTEQLDTRHIDCKAVSFVVQALKISPGASKYCSKVFGIKPAQKTQTVSTVKTVTTTKIAQETVTQTMTATTTSTTTTCFDIGKRLGRAFQFAEPTNVAHQRREPTPLQTPASSHELGQRTGSCSGAPINGFACSLISSACSCLSLLPPANVATSTKTSYTTTTVTSAADPTTVSVTTTATVFETQNADTQNDPMNCRRCGVVCSGETSFCAAARCVKPCVPGQDFSGDMSNCGGCGRICPSLPGYVCFNGQCAYQK